MISSVGKGLCGRIIWRKGERYTGGFFSIRTLIFSSRNVYAFWIQFNEIKALLRLMKSISSRRDVGCCVTKTLRQNTEVLNI